MLASLFLRGGGKAGAHAEVAPAPDAGTRGRQPDQDHGQDHNHGLPLGDTVELREVRGSLDRHLASGRASLVIHAGPGAATLRVGASEVPLLTATQTLDVHRVDSLTLRISAGAGGVDNGGNTNHNSHGNGNAAGEHSSYLLLLFANGTPAHDVARGEAVLRDLAVGRGSLGGVPQPAAAPLAPVAVAASGGRGGAAPEPLAGSSPRSATAVVLYHDPDPAKTLGWRRDHPVRLSHLERLPPVRQAPASPPSVRRAQQQLQQQQQQQDGSCGGDYANSKLAAARRSFEGGGADEDGRQPGLGLGRVWGCIAVANLAFEKDVRVRCTLNGWRTTQEVPANWDKRLGVGADSFNFLIDLDDVASSAGAHVRETLAAGRHVTLGLAVHYAVAGRDHWDNNDGSNHTFDLELD